MSWLGLELKLRLRSELIVSKVDVRIGLELRF